MCHNMILSAGMKSASTLAQAASRIARVGQEYECKFVSIIPIHSQIHVRFCGIMNEHQQTIHALNSALVSGSRESVKSLPLKDLRKMVKSGQLDKTELFPYVRGLLGETVFIQEQEQGKRVETKRGFPMKLKKRYKRKAVPLKASLGVRKKRNPKKNVQTSALISFFRAQKPKSGKGTPDIYAYIYYEFLVDPDTGKERSPDDINFEDLVNFVLMYISVCNGKVYIADAETTASVAKELKEKFESDPDIMNGVNMYKSVKVPQTIKSILANLGNSLNEENLNQALSMRIVSEESRYKWTKYVMQMAFEKIENGSSFDMKKLNQSKNKANLNGLKSFVSCAVFGLIYAASNNVTTPEETRVLRDAVLKVFNRRMKSLDPQAVEIEAAAEPGFEQPVHRLLLNLLLKGICCGDVNAVFEVVGMYINDSVFAGTGDERNPSFKRKALFTEMEYPLWDAKGDEYLAADTGVVIDEANLFAPTDAWVEKQGAESAEILDKFNDGDKAKRAALGPNILMGLNNPAVVVATVYMLKFGG